MFSRVDLRRFIAPEDLAVIVFVILGACSASALLWNEARWRPADPSRYDTELVIATTLLLAGLIQVLTRLIRWLTDFGQRRAFHAFFGAEKSAVGVVPDLKTLVDLAGWQPPESGEARPKGVTRVVAFEDLQAATKIAELFDRFSVPFELRRDYVVDGGSLEWSTFVAIGLGFNRLTCMLSECTELFRILYEDNYTGQKKDDFLIVNQPHKRPEGQWDSALIARVPFSIDGQRKIGFVCAGRMAAGTAAAGYFLKNEWRRLHDYYLRENKSLDTVALAVELRHTGGPLYRCEIVGHHFRPIIIA